MKRRIVGAVLIASSIASPCVFAGCGSLLGADADPAPPPSSAAADDGGPASDGPTEADDASVADGGSLGADASSPDGVRCGVALRCGAGESCCWSSSTESGRCIGDGGGCKPDELLLMCDVDTKCAGGAACCVRYKSLGETPTGTQCGCVNGSDSFEDYPLCTSVATCSSDMMCTGIKVLPPGYSGCGVP